MRSREDEKAIKDTLIKVRDDIIYNGLNILIEGICETLYTLEYEGFISRYNASVTKNFLSANLPKCNWSAYSWPRGKVTPRINWLNQMIYEE